MGKTPERYKLVEPGTIFYNPMRILLGSIALLDDDQPPGITSPDYVVLRPRDGIVHHRWLYYWLRSSDGAAFIKTLARGAVRERLLFRRLALGIIRLPSYQAQLRFAEAVKYVERARVAAEARLEAASRLRGAFRQTLLSQNNSWPRVMVNDLLKSPLRTGISKPQSTESHTKCLTLSSVRGDRFLDMTSVKPVDLIGSDVSKNLVRPGVFYVVRGNGNLGLVGRGAEAPDHVDGRTVFPDLLIEVDVRADLISRPFLRMIWDSDEVRLEIERRARTSAGIHKINLGNLGQVQIPVPALAVQAEAASKFALQTGEALAISSGLATEEAAIGSLPQVLLRRAFRGEL